MVIAYGWEEVERVFNEIERMSGKQKKKKMKTLLKTIGITAGVALAATMAQANIIDSESTSSGGITILSTVNEINSSDYLYCYTVSGVPTLPGVDSFTVNGASRNRRQSEYLRVCEHNWC